MPKCTWSDEPNVKIMLNLTPDWISIQQLTMTTKSSYTVSLTFLTPTSHGSQQVWILRYYGQADSVLRWWTKQRAVRTLWRLLVTATENETNTKRSAEPLTWGRSSLSSLPNFFAVQPHNFLLPSSQGERRGTRYHLGLADMGGLLGLEGGVLVGS